MDVVNTLPISRVGKLQTPRENTWLIESLWLENAAGIIGGQPKCCKSWLGLDMAVSVASNTPCLGQFKVHNPGPTLVYLAEDAVDQVRNRVEGICKNRNLILDALDLVVITVPVLRLDLEEDQKRLLATVESVSPRLLLLDPLVRLHRLDENNSRDIAGLLGFLREIQRRAQCAVVLAHHASKRACARPGQGLRGTSDLHAFGDSNLYLSRNNGDVIELVAEHRSALAPDPLQLHLTGEQGHTHLAVLENSEKQTSAASLDQRIVDYLVNSDKPISRISLRNALRTNNQRFGQSIAALLASGKIVTTANGLTIS